MRTTPPLVRGIGCLTLLFFTAPLASSQWEVVSPTPQYVYDLFGDQILPPRAAAHLDGQWDESTDPDDPLFVEEGSGLSIRIWRYDDGDLRISFWDPDTWTDPFLYPSPILTLWFFGDGQEQWTTNTVPQVAHTYQGSYGARTLQWACRDWPYAEADDYPSRTDAPCARPWADVGGVLYLHVVGNLDNHIVYVKPDGDDQLGGRSWAEAKQSITKGIEAAEVRAGDEVWVATGTYYERIEMSHGVSVLGGFEVGDTARRDRDSHGGVTTIDGGGGGPVVTVLADVDRSSVLDRFTIRNGSYGVCCEPGASPVIANNLITDNADSGIYCEGALGFEGPLIRDNEVTGNHGTAGGGIRCEGCPAVIADNHIHGNEAEVEGDGGGIWCTGGVTVLLPEIRGNTIEANRARRGTWFVHGYGGGIYAAQGNGLLVRNNRIRANDADLSGGGVFLTQVTQSEVKNNWISSNEDNGVFCDTSCGEDLLIANNTIVEHTQGDSHPSGIFCQGGSSPTLINNIIAFNTYGIYASGATPAVDHNCVWDNGTDQDYEPGSLPRTNPIDLDPLFEDVERIHVSADSPCIDVGTNSVVDGCDEDIDGQDRILASTELVVDVGADERYPGVWLAIAIEADPGVQEVGENSTVTATVSDPQTGYPVADYEVCFIVTDGRIAQYPPPSPPTHLCKTTTRVRRRSPSPGMSPALRASRPRSSNPKAEPGRNPLISSSMFLWTGRCSCTILNTRGC